MVPRLVPTELADAACNITYDTRARLDSIDGDASSRAAASGAVGGTGAHTGSQLYDAKPNASSPQQTFARSERELPAHMLGLLRRDEQAAAPPVMHGCSAWT